MEYVPGGDLYHLIEQKGKISETEARVFFQQIISAVDYCHRHQVTHRDLKPENILLDDFNNVKVGDFGLANLLRDGEFFKTSCGSPNYAAPEVLSGSLYCGTEVDVWSCGVVLYALLAGALPFDEAKLPLLYEKIKTGEYHMPYHFSEQAKDLVARMLALDPIGRITVSQIKQHPWFVIGLPPYLSKELQGMDKAAVCLTELRTYHSQRNVDLEVLEMCMQLPAFAGHEDRTIVLERLANRKAGSIGVCYELLYDAKQRFIAFYRSCALPSALTFRRLPDVDAQDRYLPLPAPNHLEKMMEIDPLSKPCNWVYGFRCQMDASSLRNVIFDGFRSLGLEWKILTTFRFTVRTLGYKEHLEGLEGKAAKPVAQEPHFKCSLCIYKYENAFVLDLALARGHALVFLDLCAQLHHYLCLKPQISSSAS